MYLGKSCDPVMIFLLSMPDEGNAFLATDSRPFIIESTAFAGSLLLAATSEVFERC
jgi:hypothetical protein